MGNVGNKGLNQTLLARPTYHLEVISVVPTPAVNTKIVIDVPPGVYNIAVMGRATVTGTTTDLALNAFVEETQATARTRPIMWSVASDVAPLVTTDVLELAGGAAAEEFWANMIFGKPTSIPTQEPGRIVIAYGLELAITVGTAVAAEELQVTVIAARLNVI